ncbi:MULTISPECIES: dihydrodipicolinate synthase family protein [unclassified Arcicella]|uniref:dihydrodipicolinate synthase family protein n=1 Tax=unclassified Arcicella TaxID=2644986 RepID=UPI00285C7319|nr:MULTISPECIES: dihydrodipicolinate synthase family protein [unclassified Arcicella]MDR6562475.1 N-acetylneuraminate lyase [Arcicella sp. BE51]MDR6812208.1 N-acetylneuraminate lyase [Arcicella sp. BE140]MDR6823539.1 N-acetylneuraminate lyase [Arcicella sp. BE139]
MKNSHLTGLIAAPFTPMYIDGTLNVSVIPQYYQMLKSNGITGAFICGSTGEGVSMTHQEKRKVAEAWANCTRDDAHFKVMMFLGGTSITDCKELAIHAKEIGLYAISFTAPFYFKPASVEVLANACLEVASVVPDMPLYYYHIPVLTGVNFAMHDLLKTIDGRIPNFAGIKYTHEDFMDYQSCLTYADQKYDMLWGRDENMLSAWALGAKGAVGSTFNYAAPLYHQLIQAFEDNELDLSRKYQMTSIEMIRLLGKYGGISTGKAYMKMIGIDCGEFRAPVRNMSKEQFEDFRKDVNSLNFSLFCSKSI